jgi:hypothetical protein
LDKLEKKEIYMVKQTFKHLNSFKRFRALEEIERNKGNIDQADKMELMQYKTIDALELSLRGLQRELNRQEGAHEEEENE